MPSPLLSLLGPLVRFWEWHRRSRAKRAELRAGPSVIEAKVDRIAEAVELQRAAAAAAIEDRQRSARREIAKDDARIEFIAKLDAGQQDVRFVCREGIRPATHVQVDIPQHDGSTLTLFAKKEAFQRGKSEIQHLRPEQLPPVGHRGSTEGRWECGGRRWRQRLIVKPARAHVKEPWFHLNHVGEPEVFDED